MFVQRFHLPFLEKIKGIPLVIFDRKFSQTPQLTENPIKNYRITSH